MIASTVIALALAGSPPTSPAPPPVAALVAHTYEARIRVAGRVSTTRVQANDAGHAKKLVQAQFPTATVLSVRKID